MFKGCWILVIKPIKVLPQISRGRSTFEPLWSQNRQNSLRAASVQQVRGGTWRMWPWIDSGLCIQTVTLHLHQRVLSPSSSCSDLKGVSAALRLLVEFPRRSGREEDTDTTEGFLLHFNTEGNWSTTGNSSVVGNSPCGTGGERRVGWKDGDSNPLS